MTGNVLNCSSHKSLSPKIMVNVSHVFFPGYFAVGAALFSFFFLAQIV